MEDILTQVLQGEGQKVEFKTSFQKEVIETIVAFANAKGGKVFVGISDKTEIIGISLNKETLQSWINQIKQNTSPSIIPDINVETIDSKKIVIIDVKEYPIKPISYKHRYLIRRANSNHMMSMEEIANEYLKTKNSSWDYYADNQHDFNHISLEKIKRFIHRIEMNFGKNFDESPIQILQKYGLSLDDKVTQGAYLLFAKDFCVLSGIQVGRFKTSTDIIDSLSLNSDLLNEIDELMIFIRKHLMVEFIITGNPQREERYDYPIDAIREIVLNMVVHRDYRDSSDSVIKIFDDRIEFFNPGDLYDNQTIEQLNTNQYQSKTRNKLIALMFKEAGLIEKYESGISRIKKLCIVHGINTPKFEELQKGFKVTLYKEATQANGGANSVYDLIKKTPNLKANQIAEHLKIPLRTIERELKSLKQQDKIIFKGATKTGGYYVK